MRSRITVVTVLSIVFLALAAPAALWAQEPAPEKEKTKAPAVAAAAPADAQVYKFTLQDFEEPACSQASEWTLSVPAGEWVQFPVIWMAKDEATARENWEHMRYQVSLDGKPLAIPDDVKERTETGKFDCPDGTMEGVSVTKMLYLPPLTGEHTYQIRYMFDDDVNDGWSTYAKGSDLSLLMKLQPKAKTKG